MINLRGQVIPVMNLRARFGMLPRPGGPGKLMIVSVAGRQVALAVDDLDEVVTVPVRDLTPPPDMVEGIGAEFLVAVCLCNERLYLVLDIDPFYDVRTAAPPGTDSGGFTAWRYLRVHRMAADHDEEIRYRRVRNSVSFRFKKVVRHSLPPLEMSSWRVRKQAVEVVLAARPDQEISIS
jgi:hypothetical protein